jgi:hypothetical protein
MKRHKLESCSDPLEPLQSSPLEPHVSVCPEHSNISNHFCRRPEASWFPAFATLSHMFVHSTLNSLQYCFSNGTSLIATCFEAYLALFASKLE